MISQSNILSANILSDGCAKKQSLIIRVPKEALEQNFTVSKIKDFIPHIFNELKNKMDPSEVWDITIEQLTDEEIDVRVGDKSYKIVKGENIQNAEVNLKILSTRPLQTQREKLSTWGGIALLFNKKPALKYIPVVGWMLGVVWGLVFPPKQDPLRPLKRHEFEAAFGAPTPQKFLDYLKLVQTQVESQKKHDSQLLDPQGQSYLDKLLLDTTSSYQNGTAIQVALKSRHQHQAVSACSDRFANEITNLSDGERLSYPLGYYKDGHYVPMLLTFYKEGESIKGQLMHMETSDSDKFNPLQLFEITKDNISSLFQQLIPFQTPPQKSNVSNEGSALGAIEDLMSLESKAAYEETKIAAEKELYEKVKKILEESQGKEGCANWKFTLGDALCTELEKNIDISKITNTSYKEILDKLKQSIAETDRKLSDVKIAQGKRTSAFKVDARDPATIILSIIKQKTNNLKASDKVKTGSKDWTKLVTRAMEDRDQKSFSFFKLSFETNFVFQLIQSQLEALSTDSKLSFSQKSRQLNELKSKLTHLEKQLKKEYGASKPLEILWQDSPDGLQRLSQIKEEIQKYEIALSQQRFNELNVGKIQPAPWQAEIPVKEGVSEKNRGEVSAVQLQEQVIRLTSSLKQQIAQKHVADVGVITTSLEQIIRKLNQLNALQAYSEAIGAANIVLEALPNVGDAFWKDFPVDQMHLLSQAISSVTQASWEAHIRLNQTHVWPNHLINFLNAQAVLYDLLQRRRVEVCKKITSDVAEEFIENITNDQKRNLIRQKQRAWYQEQADWNKKNPHNKKNESFTLPAVTFYLCENPGAIAKKANLTKAELACLFMETPAPYTSKQDQIHQLKHLLTQHPYYRFGRDPTIETRALNLVKHYEEKEALDEVKWLGTLFGTQITTTNVLVLDSYRNAEEYKVYLDGIFLANYQAALEKYDGTQTTEKDIWKSGWEHSDKAKDNFLPPELIDIRRFNVFLQTMLHPESTIKRGFASKLQQVSWAIGIVKEGAKGAANYEDKIRRAGIAEEKERRALIDALGTFRLKPGEAAEDVGANGSGPTIHITDSRGKVLLEYQPTGPLFNDFRDPFHDRGLIGSEEVISRQWAVDRVYTDDAPKDLAQKAREQHTREQQTTNRVTEVTLIADEKKQPSTDLTDEQNASLRTLVVHAGMNETGTKAIATQTFLNAMEFIFDYPSLLEREDVQRKLELALYSSGLITRCLEENKNYFTLSKFGERLTQTTQRMTEEKRYRSAAFLTLLSKHMVDHIQHSSQVEQQLTSVSDKIRANDDNHLKQLFELAVSENLDPGARKSLFTTLLAVWQDQFAGISHSELAQHIPLVAQIFIAYGYILNTPEESGDPALQNSLLDFVRGHVIPAVSALFTDPALKNDLLNAVAKQGIERKEFNGNWENTKSQFIFKSGKMEINLLTGQVNAEASQGVGNTSFLPKTVLKNPVYAKLFGDFNPEAKLEYKQEKNLQTVYEYSFQKGGHSFTVKYHPQKASVDIYQTIHAKQYRYIPALSSGETIPKDLVERYGIWQEVGAPLNAVLITKKVDEWKNEDKLSVKLRKEDRNTYHIAEVKTTKGEKVLSPDEAKEFLNIFGFAAPHNSVFVRNRHGLSEVHFLDLGVTIRKNKDGRWAGTGRWQGYVLVTNEKKVQHLMERTGTHYDQFMLAMEHKNRTTGVVKTQCFLKPMHFQSPSARSEKHERQAIEESSYEVNGLPALSLTFESGKTVGSEGQMKSSAGGFATLAYSAFVNKNYEKALQFLTRAKEERLGPMRRMFSKK